MKTRSLDAESGQISLYVRGTFADSLQPKERILSLSFLEAFSGICVKTSYRNATVILNRLLGRSGQLLSTYNGQFTKG